MANKRRKVGLTTYGFSIQNDNNERIKLHDVLGFNFLDLINQYCEDNKNIFTTNHADETVFSFENIEKNVVVDENNQELYTVLFARVKTGEFGLESEIVDSGTGIVSYKKKDKDAEVMPFGFAIFVPAGDVDNGIVILQSIGKNSIKIALHKRLDAYIKHINKDFKLKMQVIVPRVVLDRLLSNGILQSIRLIRYGIPEELANRYGVNYGTQEIVEERVIRKPIGFIQNKARELDEWRRGLRNYGDVIQIDDYEYDDLKLEFKMGKNLKTLSMKNIDKLLIAEDISDNVKIINGHPNFEDLKGEMEAIGEFYMQAKGILVKG